MKKITTALLAIAVVFSVSRIAAQTTYKLLDPVVTIDFGAGNNVPEYNSSTPDHYQRVKQSCPEDGFYAFTNHTEHCFNNDWFTLSGDHSGGGNMMLVNANPNPGVFFTTSFLQLKPGSTYQFAVYMMNVCRLNGGCSPLPPRISISITTGSGKRIAGFNTGPLAQHSAPGWKKFAGYFTVPEGETEFLLTMRNNTTGNCGNDFAMDDITIRERIEIKEEPKPVKTIKPTPQKSVTDTVKQVTVKKPTTPAQAKPQASGETAKAKPAPIATKPDSELKTVKKADGQLASSATIMDAPKATSPSATAPSIVALPAVLTQRANPVLKTINVPAGEISIDLYDNGQIDGDTVTIYHNNELVAARAGLSAQPVSFKVKIDEQQPHHEIVMVANNLGSIPPNTSLMIVTINGKRFDVFISSSEEKNAKVVIDLKQ